MKLRCGLKSNLPAMAASGEPLITTDTQELYIGTGSGVKKISDIIVSDTEPAAEDRQKIWLNAVTSVMYAYNVDSWQPVDNQSGTDFGTF